MKTYGAAIEAAIIAGVVMPREFLEIWARNRSTNAIVKERFWSDNYDITAEVLNPDTGAAESLAWVGASGLVDIDPIPRVANLTVPRVGISFVAVGANIDRILRTYDIRQAKVRIWRGYQNPTSRQMVGPAEPIFIGYLDTPDDPLGAEGTESYVRFECVSHSQEMTRSSTETRSHESQQRRDPADDFLKSAATVADQTFFWGTTIGKVTVDATGPVPTL